MESAPKLRCRTQLLYDSGLMILSGSERPSGKTHNHRSRTRQMQAELYGNSGDGVVKVPKIYWEYCTKGVLTMEWIEGIKLTDRDKLIASGFDIQHLVDQVTPIKYSVGNISNVMFITSIAG